MAIASMACCLTGTWAVEPDYVYRTQAGDTLVALGERFLTNPQDWPEVSRINHVRDPRHMPVGTPLRIPERLLKHVSRDGQVLEVVGEATVQTAPPTGSKAATPSAMSSPLKKGRTRPAGSLVHTGSNGYVTVQLADGSVLKIQADTEARLDSSQQYEAAGFFSSVWELLSGRVEALVTHMTGGEPRFQIKTPQAILGVRGTEFRVEADAQAAKTRGETLTGTVAMSGKRSDALLHAGFGSVTSAAGQVAPATALPASPDLSGQPTLQEHILVRFALPAVPGAVGYRAQVAEDADFRRVRAEVDSPTPLLRFANLPDGRYHLRARSVDQFGLSSLDAVHSFTLKARPEAPMPSSPVNGSKWRAASVPLAWAEHPQAVHYRLQVSNTADFSHPLIDRPDVSGTQLDLALPPGDYIWRVGTVAAGDDLGPWGDTQHFMVRPLPPAPPPPQVGEGVIRYQLQGEPGQHFEFQMARDPAFRDLLAEVKNSEGQISLPKPPEGGRLLLRYRAIDADGFVGPYTAAQVLTLPACVRTGSGSCMVSGSGYAVSPP